MGKAPGGVASDRPENARRGRAPDPGAGMVRVMRAEPVATGMGGLAGASRRGAPLSREEWARAERVASRLGAELSRVIGGFPEPAQSASGMARHLGVLRATCQRVVAAVRSPEASSPLMVCSLPGVQGLQQFLEGARGAGGDAADIDSALLAVEQFDQLIRDLAGSHSKLADRVRAAESAAPESESRFAERSREELFKAATQVTGRRCDTSLTIYIFRESPDVPQTMEHALVKGSIGHLGAPGGMPLVLMSGQAQKGIRVDDREMTLLDRSEARGRTPEAVLRPFSTDPLPLVTMRNTNGTAMQIIDPETSAQGQPIDIVTALFGRDPIMNPETGKPTLDAVWTLINSPARRLVVDVFLHSKLERSYRPTMDVQQWNPGLVAAEEDRWATRFPAPPTLTLLGQGLARTSCESYRRMTELERHAFARLGWDPEEYVGFRCEVAFPIWRAGYCMFFEYTGAGQGE